MDPKTFGIYFSELRKKSGYKSQRKLSSVSGVSNTTISRIEDGTQKAKPDTLKELSKYLKGVSYGDLMYKAGYLDNLSYQEREDELAKLDFFEMAEYLNSKEKSNYSISPFDKNVFDLESLYTIVHYINKPQHPNNYEIIETKIIKNQSAFALVATDNSMRNEGISQNDIVIGVKVKFINESDIAVLLDEFGKIILRKVREYFEQEKFLLIPSDSQTQPELVPTDSVQIIGKVIQIRRNIE